MFDPYRKWLGIRQYPPTHYELLGIRPDEQDPEVINEAANRQTNRLRAYQIGPRARDCSRILKEIATARLTLVNPARRQRYDEQLARIRKDPMPPTLAKAVINGHGLMSPRDDQACYSLMRETLDLAITAGQVVLAMKMAAAISERYELDELATRVDTLSRLSRVALDVDNAGQFVDIALLHASTAVVDDQFAAALKMIGAADSVARRSDSINLLSLVEKQRRQIEKIGREFDEVKNAEEELAADAGDAKANGTVGIYLAFRKGDWQTGLSLLAQCGSADLESLAQKDLAVPDNDQAHVELGDSWWNRAEKRPAYQKAAMQWRAAYWYRQGAPSLKGSARTRVAQRVKQVDARPMAFWVSTGAGEVARFEGHKGIVHWLSMSADGKRVYSCGEDGALRTWGLDTEGSRVLLGPELTRASLTCFALSPDERRVALLSIDGRLSCFELATGKPAAMPEKRDVVPGFYWFSSATVVYASRKAWHTWNPVAGIGSRMPLFSGKQRESGAARAMVMAPGRDAVAFLCNDGSVATFRVRENGRRVAGQRIAFDAGTAAFPTDPQVVVLGGMEGKLRFYSISSPTHGRGAEVRSFPGHLGTVRSIACAPDGRTIVSSGDDKVLRVWDAASSTQMFCLPHPAAVTYVVVTPDGRHAVSACADSIIRLWRVAK
jgi:hypothetical protein